MEINQMEMLIPKKIHYCWFGKNPLPEDAVRCIESWKKYCPDYEIIEWNEDNFPFDYNDYVREAYEAKKWAFVSDVARLYALVNEGGVYMDTDVEIIKPIDSILQYEAVSGFESTGEIPTGLMACMPHQPLFEKLLGDYDGKHFLKEDGSMDLTTNVTRITGICLEYGLVLNNQQQCVGGFMLMPMDVFCPKDHLTGDINITENTLAIHHFGGSWLSEEDRYALDLIKIYSKKMSRGMAARRAYYKAAWKYRGFFRGMLGDMLRNLKAKFKK
jgi:hypothetical protein